VDEGWGGELGEGDAVERVYEAYVLVALGYGVGGRRDRSTVVSISWLLDSITDSEGRWYPSAYRDRRSYGPTKEQTFGSSLRTSSAYRKGFTVEICRNWAILRKRRESRQSCV
jgi:hypothetical protein